MPASGLRPVQIWAPDAGKPGFAEECRRQSRIVAEADMADPELWNALDAILNDEAHSLPFLPPPPGT